MLQWNELPRRCMGAFIFRLIALNQHLHHNRNHQSFLKEPMLSSSAFRESIANCLETYAPETGDAVVDQLIVTILSALDTFRKNLVYRGIEDAFASAQDELDYLHVRTAEGVRRAQAEGKQVGRRSGAVCGVDFRESKKSIACKEVIRKQSADFGGSLNDTDTMTLGNAAVGSISRNTYYKYKRDLHLKQSRKTPPTEIGKAYLQDLGSDYSRY